MEKDALEGVDARFETLLEGSSSEREVQTFLKVHPFIVRNALNAHAWNSVHLKAEFPLGGKYFADFLILSADSGAWHAILIELESPVARPFNQNGTPSQALNKGLAQLDEWKIWIEKNDASFRETLSSLVKAESVPSRCSRDHQYADAEIRDPHTVIHTSYVVVVGRRRSYSDSNAQARRGEYWDRGHEIASYDRLLDTAKNLDPSTRRSE
jgi:hypothetical protein